MQVRLWNESNYEVIQYKLQRHVMEPHFSLSRNSVISWLTTPDKKQKEDRCTRSSYIAYFRLSSHGKRLIITYFLSFQCVFSIFQAYDTIHPKNALASISKPFSTGKESLCRAEAQKHVKTHGHMIGIIGYIKVDQALLFGFCKVEISDE